MAALSDIGAFARRHDPDRYLCALFAPAAKREAIFALIGFNHELARAREAARRPLAAMIRWQWWREVVEGAARRHEVATPLAAAIAAGVLDRGDLLAMIDAREVEAEESVPDRAAFEAYLAGTAGGWSVAAARALGVPEGLLPAVREAGALYGLAGVLRSVPALARQGRCLLPADVLSEAGLSAELVVADGGSAAVRQVVATMAGGAGERMAAVRDALRARPRVSVVAGLPLVFAGRDLLRFASTGTVRVGRPLADKAAVALVGLRGAF